MKKILKSALCLLALPALFTSCSSTSGSSDFKITYLSNSSFQKVCESASSSKEVYYIHLGASNNTNGAVTISKTDFVLKTGGKEYTALYFPGEINYSYVTDGSSSYIKDHTDTYSVPKNEVTGENSVSTSSFYICFEVAGETGYSITYKGNAITQY